MKLEDISIQKTSLALLLTNNIVNTKLTINSCVAHKINFMTNQYLHLTHPNTNVSAQFVLFLFSKYRKQLTKIKTTRTSKAYKHTNIQAYKHTSIQAWIQHHSRPSLNNRSVPKTTHLNQNHWK
jgi:hypothetical protein